MYHCPSEGADGGKRRDLNGALLGNDSVFVLEAILKGGPVGAESEIFSHVEMTDEVAGVSPFAGNEFFIEDDFGDFGLFAAKLLWFVSSIDIVQGSALCDGLKHLVDIHASILIRE